MAGPGRQEDLYGTLIDFGFLEAKATRVGVQRDERGTPTLYTGVQMLQDDFDLALRTMAGGRTTDRRRIVVTAADLGEGLLLRCPHCGSAHPPRPEWLGQDIDCPNEACAGPLRVNPFVVGAPTPVPGSAAEVAPGGAAGPVERAAPGPAERPAPEAPPLPLAGGAQRLLDEGEPTEGVAGANHRLLALLARFGPMAEGLVPGLSARDTIREVRERLAHGDPGPPLPRADLVAMAARHAAGRGKDRIVERDLAVAILTAAGHTVTEA
jgi:hypothetical protein